MLTVGLTGGIGAGKSEVASCLARLGAVVIDADQLAREVVAAGSDGLQEVVADFGAGVLGPDGGLDRAALGTLVFADPAARRRLEGIVHPRVHARTRQLVAAAAPDAIVVNDVPLLVEAGRTAEHHLVVVVSARLADRVRRLVEHRGMSEAEAYARIRAQATDEQRARVADVVLPNDGPLAGLRARVERLWHDRLVPFEDNLRHGRVAAAAVSGCGPGWTASVPVASGERAAAVPVTSGSGPDWAAGFARLAARIARVARPIPDVRIEHVGATSVPAAVGDGVIDIQLTAAGAGQLLALAGPLAAAGFPPMPAGAAAGTGGSGASPGGPGGSGVASGGAGGRGGAGGSGGSGVASGGADGSGRLHGSADPGCPVRLWLVARADPHWTDALVLRDWLRADPDTRSAAAADAPARARRWAGETGWRA